MSEAAMSFPSVGRSVLPKHTNLLPFRERLAGVVSAIPTKMLARWTGKTPEAAKRWKAADNAMTAEAVFALARELPEVWEIVKQECGRANDTSEAEQMLARMRELLAERHA